MIQAALLKRRAGRSKELIEKEHDLWTLKAVLHEFHKCHDDSSDAESYVWYKITIAKSLEEMKEHLTVPECRELRIVKLKEFDDFLKENDNEDA